MKKIIIFLCCVIMMGTMSTVYATEVVPLAESDTVGIYYYPESGGGVLISIDVTIGNNGKYTAQRSYATSLGEVDYDSMYNRLFVVNYCVITGTTSTGCYVELSGNVFEIDKVTGREKPIGEYEYPDIFVSYT